MRPGKYSTCVLTTGSVIHGQPQPTKGNWPVSFSKINKICCIESIPGGKITTECCNGFLQPVGGTNEKEITMLGQSKNNRFDCEFPSACLNSAAQRGWNDQLNLTTTDVCPKNILAIQWLSSWHFCRADWHCHPCMDSIHFNFKVCHHKSWISSYS